MIRSSLQRLGDFLGESLPSSNTLGSGRNLIEQKRLVGFESIALNGEAGLVEYEWHIFFLNAFTPFTSGKVTNKHLLTCRGIPLLIWVAPGGMGHFSLFLFCFPFSFVPQVETSLLPYLMFF